MSEVLGVHPLAVCCQVLYDKQILEDATELKKIKHRCDSLEMKYKYAWTSQKDCVYWLQSTVLSNLIHARFSEGIRCKNKNVVEYILDECGVEYMVEHQSPRRVFNIAPYTDCVHKPCQLLLVKDSQSVDRLYLGTQFWKAKSFQKQQSVYFFKYIMDQIYMYLPDSDDQIGQFDEGVTLFVIHSCLVPYHKNTELCVVPQGMRTFEEYIEGDVR